MSIVDEITFSLKEVEELLNSQNHQPNNIYEWRILKPNRIFWGHKRSY